MNARAGPAPAAPAAWLRASRRSPRPRRSSRRLASSRCGPTTRVPSKSLSGARRQSLCWTGPSREGRAPASHARKERSSSVVRKSSSSVVPRARRSRRRRNVDHCPTTSPDRCPSFSVLGCVYNTVDARTTLLIGRSGLDSMARLAPTTALQVPATGSTCAKSDISRDASTATPTRPTTKSACVHARAL